MNTLLGVVRDYGRMVRFSHSIFALPFALASLAFASLRVPVGPARIFWVIVAMVAARNAAMGFNRLADAAIDARNPRTAGREIPRGILGRLQVGVFVLARLPGNTGQYRIPGQLDALGLVRDRSSRGTGAYPSSGARPDPVRADAGVAVCLLSWRRLSDGGRPRGWAPHGVARPALR